MKVICKTNLDLLNEKWPSELPCKPNVGEYIQSMTKHPQYQKDESGFSLGGMPTHFVQIELEIVSVRYEPNSQGDYQCIVELHDKRSIKRNLYDFYGWYAPIVGKTRGSFI